MRGECGFHTVSDEVLLLELTAWPEPPTIQHLFSADWNDEGHVFSEAACETDRDLRNEATEIRSNRHSLPNNNNY
jgi:hypothetical protein